VFCLWVPFDLFFCSQKSHLIFHTFLRFLAHARLSSNLAKHHTPRRENERSVHAHNPEPSGISRGRRRVVFENSHEDVAEVRIHGYVSRSHRSRFLRFTTKHF